MTVRRLTLSRPDDWHVHLRDGAVLSCTVAHTAARFVRAIVMPNLSPPVTTLPQALAYRKRILAALAPGTAFTPLMTLYLTDNTTAAEIESAAQSGCVAAVKLYPAGVTTNADSGVTAIDKVYGVLEAMAAHDLPLLVHGEVNDPAVDIFDRETVFIERVLAPLAARLPQLRIVLEHITTADAVRFVSEAPETLAATITAHHLLIDRNAMFAGGIRPHMYCLPVAKREHHRQALLDAATGGNPKFFLGTDSAPHERRRKEAACGCAGIYTAHAAIELYAEAFDQRNALDRLEAFASHHGADFYRMPRNTERIALIGEATTVPREYRFGDGTLIPFRSGESLKWRLVT